MSKNRNNILTKLRLQSSLDDVVNINFWKALVAECFGTFILVFIGLGSCYGDAKLVGEGKLLVAALAFGLAGALGIWSTAPISGGNINPAVSLGLLIARKMSLVRCILYMVFQFAGATAASKLIGIMTKGVFHVHGLSIATVSAYQAFYCEIVITFVLVFTVMRMCVEKSRSDTERGVAALAIGLSITVGILCGANISGGSMNPARTLGPAVVNSFYDNIWVYIAGPLIGGAIAGLLQQLLFTSELSKEHIVDYLISSEFDSEVSEVENHDDLESNNSTEKNLFNKSHKFSSQNDTNKNPEKLELLPQHEALVMES